MGWSTLAGFSKVVGEHLVRMHLQALARQWESAKMASPA